MKLIGKQVLHEFKEKHSDARAQIESWMSEIEFAEWVMPLHIKRQYPKASLLKQQNVIFDICGNKYRLWVKVNYKNKIVLVKKIGNHKEYDSWKII